MGNSLFLPVHNPVLASNINWNVKVFSVSDNFTTPLAVIEDFVELVGSVSLCDVGGGSVTLDLDSPVFTTNLTNGEPGSYLLTPGLLFRAYESGVARFEFFAERRSATEASSDNSVRAVTVSGRGSAAALARARVLTPGFPTTTTTFWNFKDQSRMSAWMRLFNAAKQRGTVTYVSPMFTMNADSNGTPWADTPTSVSSQPVYTPDLNQDLLDVLNVVTGQNIDEVAGMRAEWVMHPGFKLDVRPTIGVHREHEIVFNDGGAVNSREMDASSEDLANYVAVRDVYGRVSLARSTESADEFGQVEILHEYNHLTNPNNARAVANTLLELSKDEYMSWTLSVKPDYVGRTVFRDFGIGDWVGVDKFNATSGASTVQEFRVMSIGVSVNRDSYTCELTLNSRLDLNIRKLKERLNKIINMPNPGTLPTLPSPSPIPGGGGGGPYGLVPVDGRWDWYDFNGGGRPPIVISATEPSISECPVGYFWLRPTGL